MKHLVLIVLSLLFLTEVIAQTNVNPDLEISLTENFEMVADGETVSYLTVYETSQEEYCAFQMKINLPKGISVNKIQVGNNEVNDVKLNSVRFDGLKHQISVLGYDGYIWIICYSYPNANFYNVDETGNVVKELFKIGLVASEETPIGKDVITLSEVEFANSANLGDVPSSDIFTDITVLPGVEKYTAISWDGYSYKVAPEFADVVADANLGGVANNVDIENVSSIVKFNTRSIIAQAVGGATAKNCDATSVKEWNDIRWDWRHQSKYGFILGTGLPVFGYDIEETGESTGYYQVNYDGYYYTPGGGNMPAQGLYYKFSAKAKGLLKIGVWVNKGGRNTYLVDETTTKPVEYRTEGYFLGKSDADGNDIWFNSAEIKSLHDASGNADNPYVIGTGQMVFWGNVMYEISEGQTVWLFNDISPIGFHGFEFIPNGSYPDEYGNDPNVEPDNFEYAMIDYDKLGVRFHEYNPMSAGTILASSENVEMALAFDDNTRSIDFVGGTTEYNFGEKCQLTMDYVLQGETNPKDINGETPASSLNVPASGAAYRLKVKADGYMYLLTSITPKKAITVFENGKCIPYALGMSNARFNSASYQLIGNSDGCMDVPLLCPESMINHVLADYEESSSGPGVVRFPVKAGAEYLVNANASKLGLGGYFFDREAECTVTASSSHGNGCLLYSNEKTPEYYTVYLDSETEGVTLSGFGGYKPGATATIRSTAEPGGLQFRCWSDGNYDNPRQITVNSNIYLSALHGNDQNIEITIDVPGTLPPNVPNPEIVEALTIRGGLNGTDINYIRTKMPRLRMLNLTEAWIVEGGDNYYSNLYVDSKGVMQPLSTSDYTIGDYMFSDMTELHELMVCQQTTAIGRSVIAGSSNVMMFIVPNEVKTVTKGMLDDVNPRLQVVWEARDGVIEGLSNNPNLFIYAYNNYTGNKDVKNFVLNGTAESVVLTDNVSLFINEGFRAKKISYIRNFSKPTIPEEASGWESIVLPFDVKNFISEDKGKLVPFKSEEAGKHQFWLAQLGQNGFELTSTMQANIPYIICMPNSEKYDSNYNITGNVAFYAESEDGIEVYPTEDVNDAQGPEFRFVPNYETMIPSPDRYVLNDDILYDKPAGSIFARELEGLPFRPYVVDVSSSNGARGFVPVFGSVTGINNVLTGQSSEYTDGIFDVEGRRYQPGQMTSGKVYIINGKKILDK